MPPSRPAVVLSDAWLRGPQASGGVRVSPEPMSIDRARAILGREALGLSDEEVLEACRQAEILAHIIVQMFVASDLAGERRM